MSAEEQTRFLQELADDLNSRNIALPSFPDVVINIRAALEDPGCTTERLGDVVRTDPILAARLLISANSAFHNRAGIEFIDLNLAISRLGFEVVRNTAITLAVEQIFNASQHKGLRDHIMQLWNRSISMASMCFVIARNSGEINADSAFLCGLLHEVGKLYILTKAKEFPALMGDSDSLNTVMTQWHNSVGKSIVESWGFSDEIADSMETGDGKRDDQAAPATLVDVIFAAHMILQSNEEQELDDSLRSAVAKLKIGDETLPALREAYDLHAQSMHQAAGS